MQFMAPVTVTCDVCQGRRFRPEVLAVRYRGRDIHETLELTVEQALASLTDLKGLCRRLGRWPTSASATCASASRPRPSPAARRSGSSSPASSTARPSDGRRLFLFDEPTTGLHLADIDLLYQTLRRLVQQGDGVVVVEHSPDLIARADWIVDLGPGGGVHGGELLFSGPLEPFLGRGGEPDRRRAAPAPALGAGRGAARVRVAEWSFRGLPGGSGRGTRLRRGFPPAPQGGCRREALRAGRPRPEPPYHLAQTTGDMAGAAPGGRRQQVEATSGRCVARPARGARI